MAEVLQGTAESEELTLTENEGQAYGWQGDDTLISDNKKDVQLIGGSGDDSLVMTGGNGTLSGGAGADVFDLNYSADKKLSAVIADFEPSSDSIVVNGDKSPQLNTVKSGDDVIWTDDDDNFNVTVKTMAEVLHGSKSNEQLVATKGRTQIYGLKGDDTLISDNHSGVLLVGGSGEDSLVMTGGNGTLNGGEGSDVFEFTYSADKPISAVIEDLNPSEDKIVVNYDGNTAPQISSSTSGNDVVLNDDSGNFKVTLKSVRENDYFDDEAREEIWEVLRLTNAEREKANLPALTLAQGLMAGASVRAEEISDKAQTGVLEDHTRPGNKGKYDTVFEGKYNFPAENLDAGARTPGDVVDDWMKSDSHKKNILDEENNGYKKVGVGYFYVNLDETDLRWY